MEKYIISGRDLAGPVVLTEDGEFFPPDDPDAAFWLFADEDEALQEAQEMFADTGNAFDELLVKEIETDEDGFPDWESVSW